MRRVTFARLPGAIIALVNGRIIAVPHSSEDSIPPRVGPPSPDAMDLPRLEQKPLNRHERRKTAALNRRRAQCPWASTSTTHAREAQSHDD